jgi:hypothetical protein
MPRPRAGYRQLSAQVPEDVEAAFSQLALTNGRSVAEELTHAMRRHLRKPPVIETVVREEELEDATIPAPPPAPKRPRGRPRKKTS